MTLLGLWGEHATDYLLVFVAGTTLIFSIPISFAPLVWARLFQWRIPDDTDLAVYFGRCLGAFALLFEALMLRAAVLGHDIALVFVMLMCVCAAMVVIHIWGAIRRQQPWTETAEIGLWAAFFALTWLFFPVTAAA